MLLDAQSTGERPDRRAAPSPGPGQDLRQRAHLRAGDLGGLCPAAEPVGQQHPPSGAPCRAGRKACTTAPGPRWPPERFRRSRPPAPARRATAGGRRPLAGRDPRQRAARPVAGPAL